MIQALKELHISKQWTWNYDKYLEFCESVHHVQNNLKTSNCADKKI